MIEHGQFCREMEQCQVGRRLRHVGHRWVAGVRPPWLRHSGACSALWALPAVYMTPRPAPLQVYARGRVALTGDAAHLGTPFLGQVGAAGEQRGTRS